MISTRNLSLLPDVPALLRLTQSLAMLDAILSAEWEGRYYSFNARWAEGEQMASMRDGSGDEWHLLFSSAGAALKGFAHESPMATPDTWPGVLSDAPPIFQSFLTEPAFMLEDTTFCLWRTPSDTEWHRGTVNFPAGADPDGSEDLLAIFDGQPRTYQQWAEEYYERDVSLAVVEHVYGHRPLTPEIVASLNAEITLAALAEDIAEIGYPVRG